MRCEDPNCPVQDPKQLVVCDEIGEEGNVALIRDDSNGSHISNVFLTATEAQRMLDLAGAGGMWISIERADYVLAELDDGTKGRGVEKDLCRLVMERLPTEPRHYCHDHYPVPSLVVEYHSQDHSHFSLYADAGQPPLDALWRKFESGLGSKAAFVVLRRADDEHADYHNLGALVKQHLGLRFDSPVDAEAVVRDLAALLRGPFDTPRKTNS